MKRVIKIVGFVILGIVLLIVLLLGILLVKNYMDSHKPWLEPDYYTQFQSDAALEKKYAGLGGYEVSSIVYPSEDDTIKNIRVWYPSELEQNDQTYPLILVTNASNMAALNYEPFFERLASWGFIVAGNDDRQSGTGESTSHTLDALLEQNEAADSLLAGKIDTDRIGVVGYSQGGAGAIRAVTEYENSIRYKALFTGSAAYSYLAQMWGGYDASKVMIPWFMTAGTGTSDDAGVADTTTEWGGVAPLSSLIENYDRMPNDVYKIRARVSGAEHEQMQERTDGYMTAWMLFQLKGDTEAAKVFTGQDAEILHNANWQDIEKNL